ATDYPTLAKKTFPTSIRREYARSSRVATRLNRSSARTRLPLVGLFQRFDIDFLHLKHRLHHAFGFFLIAIMQHVDQNGWRHLPRHPEFIFKPAARRFLATVCGEFLPEIIHFLLRVAVYYKGDRFVEFEKQAAVKSDEPLAFDFELNRQYRSDRPPCFFRCLFGIAENSNDLRIFEERRVKVHGLLGLIIKPKEWSNFLHRNFVASIRTISQQNLAFHGKSIQCFDVNRQSCTLDFSVVSSEVETSLD